MSCPKCGYCKECGRSNYPTYAPYVYPNTAPWITYTVPQSTTTVTSGGGAYPTAASAQSFQISNSKVTS